MLLAPIDASLRLADVMPSCLQALSGASNPLGLAPVTHAAVLVVDGMGAANLRDHAGHARWLTRAWKAHGLRADAGFPSTTASALTTLTTGVQAGEHGIAGYSLRDPESGQIVNHLKDWEPTVELGSWQRSQTVFERAAAQGIPSLSQGEARFADSDFTKAVWRGAEFRAARSLSEQFDNAKAFFDSTPLGLAYLYWPALDRTGHGSGCESDSWPTASRSWTRSSVNARLSWVPRQDSSLRLITGWWMWPMTTKSWCRLIRRSWRVWLRGRASLARRKSTYRRVRNATSW